MDLKKRIIKNYVNFRGKSLYGRKIVLIESDDWGSIRMPSRAVYNKLVQSGLQIDNVYFDKYDSLESEDDLTELFDVLTSVKDSNGRNAIIAPYTLSANPNYEKIQEYNFEQYFYEPVIETYLRHPHTEHAFPIIKQGIKQGIWDPQFHGREHVNVRRWLKACQRNNTNTKIAFEEHAFVAMAFPQDLYCFPAFDYDDEKEFCEIKKIISEGIDLFKQLYNVSPISICPPCGMMNKNVFQIAVDKGIRLLPGQLFTHKRSGDYKKIDYFWGEKYGDKSIFYRRNCKFEPSNHLNPDPVNSCLEEIDLAFKWGKPAVIDSHRVNYIGSIFPENRERSLRLLKTLLVTIVKMWPDVEFMTCKEIYELYK